MLSATPAMFESAQSSFGSPPFWPPLVISVNSF
jgi:hypothetical protein